MKTLKLICLLAFMIFILILTSCVSVKTTKSPPLLLDPSGGYVLFHYTKGFEKFNHIPKVYSLIDNEEVFEGEIATVFHARKKEISLQLVKIPGVYEFIVYVGEYDSRFFIQIEEGMVTSIEMVFVDFHNPQIPLNLYPCVDETSSIIEYNEKIGKKQRSKTNLLILPFTLN